MPELNRVSPRAKRYSSESASHQSRSAYLRNIAEIGAGQEVARWFPQVGAASGTVAKTISAYDKEVSDDLYGAVSRPRLQSMLEREWSQLLSQLNASRGATTRFFSFVDTVSARNFAGDNECHGWVGLRFQMQPMGEPNEAILHINLCDHSNLAQQAAGRDAKKTYKGLRISYSRMLEIPALSGGSELEFL